MIILPFYIYIYIQRERETETPSILCVHVCIDHRPCIKPQREYQ